MTMSESFVPPASLDREFLPIRAKILEIAAALDRIQRAAAANATVEVGQKIVESTSLATDASVDSSTGRPKTIFDDRQWQQLQAGIQLLLTDEAVRAERVQLLFSKPYDEKWRELLETSS